jgi:hypothetical protein
VFPVTGPVKGGALSSTTTQPTRALALPTNYSETVYREAVPALDHILALHDPTFSDLLEIEGWLDQIGESLQDADSHREHYGWETPTTLLADFEVGLRMQDVFAHVESLWSSPQVRSDILGELASLNRALVGGRVIKHDVCFEVSENWYTQTLDYPIRAFKIPGTSRYYTGSAGVSRTRRVAVVKAPYWVWNLFNTIVSSPRLQKHLWNRYTANVRLDPENLAAIIVGEPLDPVRLGPVPLALWDPGILTLAEAVRASEAL